MVNISISKPVRIACDLYIYINRPVANVLENLSSTILQEVIFEFFSRAIARFYTEKISYRSQDCRDEEIWLCGSTLV